VLKNNQNNGDLITSLSSISALTCVPGIAISAHKARQLITMVEINAVLRHLYLSVMAPMTGRISKAGIVSNVKIKPTMIDE